jgi:YbgC/YbaW family acyl-CoA thioester hydrolase
LIASRRDLDHPDTDARSVNAMAGRADFEVSWGDLDPAAIVFYPHFFAWADAATHRLFRKVGSPMDALLVKQRISFGLVACSAQFHSPVRQCDRLECRTTVAKIGTASLELEHVFRVGRRPVATVRETRVCMDLSDPKALAARELPTRLRKRLAASKR